MPERRNGFVMAIGSSLTLSNSLNRIRRKKMPADNPKISSPKGRKMPHLIHSNPAASSSHRQSAVCLRRLILATLLLLAGCAHRIDDPARYLPHPKPTKEIKLGNYAQPFGHAPAEPDLEKILLSLPDQLVGDMRNEIRKLYIEYSDRSSSMPLFDRPHKYATFYTDNPYSRMRASSIFFLKVYPSRRYGYIVAIHLMKPLCLDVPPSPGNTFFLAPRDSRWVDITDKILPPQVSRNWFFQPLRNSNVIETGPYQALPGGRWNGVMKTYDLVWNGDSFLLKRPRSKEFSPGF